MMTHGMKTLLLALLCALALLLAGCGGGGDDAESTTEQAVESAADAAADAAAEIAVHDCDGACGMKDVPLDQLTKVDDKFYCAGCAKKAQEEHKGHDHDHG